MVDRIGGADICFTFLTMFIVIEKQTNVSNGGKIQHKTISYAD